MTFSTLSAIIALVFGFVATGAGIAADVTRNTKLALVSLAMVVLLLVTAVIRFIALG
jgi:hypothetical protein